MSEKELHRDEFDLEDILKEFAGSTDVPLDEDIRIWDGNIPEISHTPAVGPDTVRLDAITRAVRAAEQAANEQTVRFAPVEDPQQTVRFAPIGDADQTVRFTPVGGEEEEPEAYVPPQPEETVEPFSEKWEPEYEQPIGEYIPPQPIIFRPKSRLRELKRKLVEGPERRYYDLEEKGIGKLQAAIFGSFLVTAAAAFGAVMYQFDMVSPERMRLMVFSQVFLMLLAALFGSYQMMEGFGDLIHKRFSLNTLLVFSFLACCADGIMCLNQLRVPCCAAFSLHVTLSLIGSLQKRNVELAQMDTMRKAIRLDSLTLTEDFYEGRPGYLRGEGQVEDFMDTYDRPSGPEKVVSVYAFVALLVALVAAVYAGISHSMTLAVQVFSVTLLVAIPVSTHVAFSRPAFLLQRRLRKHGSVICGWQGVVGLCRNAAFPLTDRDLVPSGTVKLNGVKFYGSREPDEVVAYAAAVIGADGGSMAPLVEQLLESRSGYHYDAQQLQSYPGGIGAVVNGEAVLAGTLAFMQSMGVDMPNGTKVNQAVYVSIDGELVGVFAVTHNKVKTAGAGLTTLCSYRRLIPVLVTGDFMLTESFLRGKFGVNTRRIAFLPRAERSALAKREPSVEDPVLALTTKEGLAGMAYAVTGSRALRASCITGTVVHMLGGILGILIVAALMIVGADHLMTSYNILLYQLLWMIPGLLITEWTRSV